MSEKVWRAKEYLVAQGLIAKAGRGRMSATAHEFLKNALSEGVKFSDYPKKDVTVMVSGKETKVEAKKPKAEFLDVAPEVFPQSARVYSRIDGKKVYGTMRACCFYCSVSLYWCTCAYFNRQPLAIVDNTHGYVPVTVEV